MRGLTARQAQVLALIENFIEQNGYPPTNREVCVLMDATSPHSSTDMLKALEKNGCIKRTPGLARSLVVVAKDDGDDEFDRMSRQIDELTNSRDFYRIRMQAIEGLQSELPEPWRTLVCNVLANGKARAD